MEGNKGGYEGEQVGANVEAQAGCLYFKEQALRDNKANSYMCLAVDAI